MTTNILTLAEKQELIKLIERQEKYEKETKFFRWFENREGYHKHLSFLADGKTYRQRVFLAGNRTGKSETGAFETTCHLTGLYPDWFEGKRFDHATNGWVVSKTSATGKETTQVALLGPLGEWGTGMLPKEFIIHVGKSTASTADYVQVKHVSGGISTAYFKTNDAGRTAFEGTAKDFIAIDEECDEDVYMECLMRTMTTNGIIYNTFTPLRGLSPLVMTFLQDGNIETPKEGISVTTCSWDDAPHLDDATKTEMLSRLPPWQRMSRSKGIPSLGSGVIYAVDPEDYTIDPFEIPANWLRFAGMDVGWKRTAAAFFAINPEDNTLYIIGEHYRGEAEPVIHAEAIKTHGKVPIAIDSAAHGRSQIDGEQLFKLYEELGLELHNADKAIEAGLSTVWSMLSFGKLKIFKNCTNLLSEMKTYRRDDKGKIVKSNDHLMDAMRYGVMTRDIARTLQPKKVFDHLQHGYNRHTKTGL